MKHSAIRRTASLAAALAVPCGLSFGLAGTLAPTGDLVTTYAEGKSFTVAVQLETETTSERSVSVDGEPMDQPGMGESTRSMSFAFDHTDAYAAVTDGAPMKLTREFGEVAASMSAERRGEPWERELESPFPGVKLILEDEDGEVTATVDGDEDVPDEKLEGHAMAFALDALLPEDPDAEESSWEIAPEALARALQVDATSLLLSAPERPERPEGRRGPRGGDGEARPRRGVPSPLGALFSEGLEWTIEARIADETEEKDGQSFAVIEIEARVEGETPERMGRRGGRRGGRAPLAGGPSPTAVPGDLTGEFEGRLLWSAADAHPAHFEFSGEFETSSERSMETERGFIEMSSMGSTRVDFSTSISSGAAKAPETGEDRGGK